MPSPQGVKFRDGVPDDVFDFLSSKTSQEIADLMYAAQITGARGKDILAAYLRAVCGESAVAMFSVSDTHENYLIVSGEDFILGETSAGIRRFVALVDAGMYPHLQRPRII